VCARLPIATHTHTTQQKTSITHHRKTKPGVAAPGAVLGYHEGTQRAVKCADGGYVKGLTAYFSGEGGEKVDSFIAGVRVHCSRCVDGGWPAAGFKSAAGKNRARD
jgi:hypothetical protein